MAGTSIPGVAIRGIASAVPEGTKGLPELAELVGAADAEKIVQSTGVRNAACIPSRSNGGGSILRRGGIVAEEFVVGTGIHRGAFVCFANLRLHPAGHQLLFAGAFGIAQKLRRF